MKKLLLILLILITNLVFAQNIKDKYQSSQAQDPSVPPPPRVSFPAQFPGGNRVFVEKIKKNLNPKNFTGKNGKYETVIILKISDVGEVLNISTYGKNQDFNKEVEKAGKITTENIKWEAGKNRLGEKVIDVTRIPFKYIKKN